MAAEPLPFNGAGIPMKDLAPRGGGGDGPSTPAPADPKTFTRATAKTVIRDLPLVTIQNTWSIDQVRGALYAHMTGIFESSSQLWESIVGDDRVTATIKSRLSGLFGREVIFKPANDSDAAREVLDAWTNAWPDFYGDGSQVGATAKTKIGMGFAHAQIVWDTSGPVWKPRLSPWHPRFTYFYWPTFRYHALTQDGDVPITPGNGKWFQLGWYRSWIDGAVRPVAEPWMLRHFGFRDMARFSEVHGLPTRVGEVPAVSDPVERAAFETALASLGSDSTMIVPKGVDGQGGDGYGYSLVEAKDRAWESFGALIDRCDMAIVLAILMQNLTTQVSTGSYAATQSHMDIRLSGIQDDNTVWKHAIRSQVARQFAWLNFGDPDLAPWTEWDVTSSEELAATAERFSKFGLAIEVLSRGGIRFTDAGKLRRFARDNFGLRGLPDFEIKEPVVGGLGGAPKSKLPFTDVDPSSVVTVNEARELNGLPSMSGGDVTIQEFHEDKAAAREKDVDAAKADDDPKETPDEATADQKG